MPVLSGSETDSVVAFGIQISPCLHEKLALIDHWAAKIAAAACFLLLF
jgi:hypothetical protein